MDIKELENEKYVVAYSEDKLFNKIIKFAKKAGIKLVYVVLLLFYTLQKSTTPKFAKSIIIGGLGYFIIPLDIVSDFIPVIGFTDDLTALISVLITVALFIDEDIKLRAKLKLKDWFGDFDQKELDDIEDKLNKD
ncbi:MAG: YkvA family protein [Erysipelotrichaceae bacterium]